MLKLLKGILKLLIAIVATIVAYIGINEGMAAYVHYKIDEDYLSTSENYIYVSDKVNEESAVYAVTSTIEKFPEKFAKEFKSSWKVVISPEAPDEMTEVVTSHISKVAGLNHPVSKTIWISSDSEEYYGELFAHELGHYLAYELGGEDQTKVFIDLYNKHKDTYVEYEKTEVDAYNISTTNEFFAMLCEEYICYPDYLKEHFPDGYKYIEKQMRKNPYSFFLSGYINEFISTARIIKSQIEENLKTYQNLM